MELGANGQKIVIDIATRVVTDDEKVYIIQPGKNYSFYSHFRKLNHVFLDFPHLLDGNPEGPFKLGDDSFPVAPDPKVMRRMIVRSRAIGSWIDLERKGPAPDVDLADYEGRDHRKRLGRYVGAITRLYWDIPVGTILIVPGPNYYDDVLIGEIVGGKTFLRDDAIYDGAPMLARRVKWHRSKPKSFFSKELRDKFGKPNPLTQLDKSLRREILQAGFDQYAFDHEYTARLNTTKAEFTTVDDYDIQTFVNYVTGVLAALDSAYKQELSVDEAIGFLHADRMQALDLKLNINSAGFQRLIDETVKPLVIAVLLTAATSGQAQANDGFPAIEVINSASAQADACTLEVSKRVEGSIKLMKLDAWVKVCKHAREVQHSTGLSTSMRVKHKGKARP